MKMLRPLLTSDKTVADMRAKYGRPGVSGRKRVHPGSDVENINVKSPRFKVADVEIFINNGEDQRSTEKNLTVIATEMKKLQPDKVILADKLKRTAPYRQKLCLEETTAKVLEVFPCLRQHLFLIGDVTLFYGLDLRKMAILEDLSPKLEKLNAIKLRGAVADELKAITAQHYRKLDEYPDEKTKKDMSVMYGMRLLMMYLGENGDSLCLSSREAASSPIPSIAADDGKWSVMFDNLCLIERTKYYRAALEAWFAIFWVFSVKYPESLKNTCLFIEKYVCGGKVTIPGIVRRLGEKVL